MQERVALFRVSRRRRCVADASVRRVIRKGTHRHSRWFFMYTLRLCYQQRPNRRIADLASAFLLLAARKRAVRVRKAKLRTQFILHYGKKSWLYHRKRLLFFPLKFQRNNRKNALAMNSAKGKTGEKGCIFHCIAK